MNSDEVSAEKILQAAATELAEIHRAKHYALWRGDTARRLNTELGELLPFAPFRDLWIYTGDGGYVTATARFGEWAIDRLLEKNTVSEIFALFEAEASRNMGSYSEISPVLGATVDERCDFGDGSALVPEPADALDKIFHRPQGLSVSVPPGTAMLVQNYQVTPAFEHRSAEHHARPDTSITAPTAATRHTVRERVRLACLLAGAGAVEMPITLLQPDRRLLFAAGEGNQSGRPFAAVPIATSPMRSAVLRTAYAAFARFADLGSLSRAIDRLGRSRLATSPVDRALELGIAAEIALMHGHGESNAEITHKIGTRAAWLLGEDPAEREAVFADTKKLYAARSQAVHSGVLTSSRAKLDLDAADRLVTRILLAILDLGSFPDWTRLAMGGGAIANRS